MRLFYYNAYEYGNGAPELELAVYADSFEGAASEMTKQVSRLGFVGSVEPHQLLVVTNDGLMPEKEFYK